MVGLESQQIDRSSVSHKNRFSISPSGECNFVRKCVSHTNYVWRRLKGNQGPCMLSKTCSCRRVRLRTTLLGVEYFHLTSCPPIVWSDHSKLVDAFNFLHQKMHIAAVNWINITGEFVLAE